MIKICQLLPIYGNLPSYSTHTAAVCSIFSCNKILKIFWSANSFVMKLQCVWFWIWNPYTYANIGLIYIVWKHICLRIARGLYTMIKKCNWINNISAKSTYVYHGYKSICYRNSNIFIGSCSIFLWINSIHAFSKNDMDSKALFLSVDADS